MDLVMIYGGGEIHHNNYWRYYAPALFVGSPATMMAFLALNIEVMTSVPPAMAGVAGALFQVVLQTGAVIGLSIQAGFLTRQEGSVSNWANVQASLWFQFGWGILFAILFVALFRPGKKAAVAKSKEGERKDVGTVV